MRRSDAHHDTRVIVSPKARLQVRRAYLWYRREDPRAAARFQAAFQEALERLAEAPLRWAEVEPDIRRFLLPRHPYSLRYAVEVSMVEILTIVHQARHPDTGRRRQ